MGISRATVQCKRPVGSMQAPLGQCKRPSTIRRPPRRQHQVAVIMSTSSPARRASAVQVVLSFQKFQAHEGIKGKCVCRGILEPMSTCVFAKRLTVDRHECMHMYLPNFLQYTVERMKP